LNTFSMHNEYVSRMCLSHVSLRNSGNFSLPKQDVPLTVLGFGALSEDGTKADQLQVRGIFVDLLWLRHFAS
jgi:hypothetical protein